MGLFRQIEHIKAQIVDTERLLTLAGNHPLMTASFKSRLDDLNRQLESLPKEAFEPKINLLFSGQAVRGSSGVKASFISKVLLPFQEMIKTQAAMVRFGNVSKRGQAKKGANAELFITALPTGSFGIELSQLESNDLFAEQEVAKAMKQVMQLVIDTAESDQAFEESIEATPKRSLNNLKKFLKEIVEEHSILKMETGEMGVELSEEGIAQAYIRVTSTVDEEQEEFIGAVLRGILLDSARFEIQTNNGLAISGFISEDITEEELIKYDQTYLNKSCVVHLRLHKTSFKTGNEQVYYELLEIMDTDPTV
jgi:hypothetical protein